MCKCGGEKCNVNIPPFGETVVSESVPDSERIINEEYVSDLKLAVHEL